MRSFTHTEEYSTLYDLPGRILAYAYCGQCGISSETGFQINFLYWVYSDPIANHILPYSNKIQNLFPYLCCCMRSLTTHDESDKTHQRTDCTIDNAGHDGDISSAVANLCENSLKPRLFVLVFVSHAASNFSPAKLQKLRDKIRCYRKFVSGTFPGKKLQLAGKISYRKYERDNTV